MRSSRSVLTSGVAALVSTALLVSCSSGSTLPPQGKAASVAADPRTVDVNVADLSPLYNGTDTTTWEHVRALKERGRAGVVYLYADDSGNYAYVFDEGEQFQAWACEPAQPKRPLCNEARDLNLRLGNQPINEAKEIKLDD